MQFTSEPGGQVWPLPADQTGPLSERVQALHERIRRVAPAVDRMACALHDAEDDLLKTFVHSTHGSEPLTAYQYPLSASPSLLQLAHKRQARVIGDIPATLTGDSAHSRWVKEQGYRSSYTVPLFQQSVFGGFLFFDSRTPDAFTPEVVAQLDVYAQLIALMISHEVTAIRALVGSVRVARDFAHLRNVETGTHLDRMSRYVRLIARGLAQSHQLSDEFVEELFLFAPLHDIGKIGVPDAILLKPGAYTPEERQLMTRHVTLGSEMIERLIHDFQIGSVAGLGTLRRLVACHHEYLDGSGYPQGLRGDEIPLEARIVTVADIFDALTSRRVYKPRWPLERACETLDAMVAAGKIDAACVAALHAGRAEVDAIMARFDEDEQRTQSPMRC
jgi:HD-GYP domain-containing protein (c-di-GMP phosphodiesterase class II)